MSHKRPVKPSLRPWLFQVEPYEEESFGHYLGRFRTANDLSSAHLSAMLNQRSHTVSYWESPSRQRRPDPISLKRLSDFTGVAVPRLCQMWPSKGTQLHWPTRMCPQCYREAPWHRLTWQLADQPYCEIHRQPLLSACPCCGSALRLPSYWQAGECDRGCRLR